MKKILIVDDSPTERHFLGELLTKSGYQVVMLESGEEAVARTSEIMPDLILMDVVMPGLNGFQATRTLSREAATKHIPIIMCTSKGQETDVVWGKRQGARGYVVKPVDPAELLGQIQAIAAEDSASSAG
ncbi:response regulator [Burkholderiaceae bacterium DAT-1]|nr:response regulator [Burkholderiaceae bacterium DAT-1]